ncbi:potassium-transporting ATPase subunit C [Arthrobacter sp. LAPM80]|uniref:potassium-transporting ATPase subunit C n=1 Tax=Arthrobacter sp. LAPM80 TaxID=3141788 RepID=UPI00398BA0E6
MTHDSLPPLAGGLALLNMMLGETAPGGMGSGQDGLLGLASLSLFAGWDSSLPRPRFFYPRPAEVAAREHVAPARVPIDAVTVSGSGLDPDISTAYAALQVPRVASANGLSEAAVKALVAQNTSTGLNAFLGQASVNTTTLNAALVQLQK